MKVKRGGEPLARSAPLLPLSLFNPLPASLPPLSAPRRSDSDGEDEWLPNPKKHVPEWTQQDKLKAALAKQQKVDPDRLFGAQMETCPLEDIFKVREREC